MIYFGIEIYDGKPLKPFLLDENISLEDQWYLLTEDITCIDYLINGFEFSIDIGWYLKSEVTPLSYFKTIIIEGPVTEGGIYFQRKSNTLVDLRNDLKEAVLLIQKLKELNKEEILKMQLE